jgi:hypothetical protein
MSQARGRFAGSRDSGHRRPGHEKNSPPSRQGRPYVKAPPPEAADTASIFKTRSFRFLVDAVGAENIAIALESNMTRVTELMKGERFTPETAFHMETTLGLPHGFFDQPNPGLAAETIARLKSPLDFIQTDDTRDGEAEAPMPTSVANVDQQPVPENSLSEEAQMPKKTVGGSTRAARNKQSEMAGPTESRAPAKTSSPKSRPSAKTPQQQPLALGDGAEVETIRRANLHVLTGRNGSKTRLGVVMAMSGSNMAHRLYGKKRMDDIEASRFTEGLGLPSGWLDTPRVESEIPESVSQLLTPAARGRATGQPDEQLAPAANGNAQDKAIEAKPRARRTQARFSGNAETPSPVSLESSAEKTATVPGSQEQDDRVSGVSSRRSPDGGDQEALAKAGTAKPEPRAASTIPQPDPAAIALASVASLDNLHGIGPIAEALLKTLAGKARTGRLDELKALELLQQAVLL